VLVLGLESGVRGIFGLDTNALLYSGGNSGVLREGAVLPPTSLALPPFTTLGGLSSAAKLDVGLGPFLDLDEVEGLLCCSDTPWIVAVVGVGLLS